MSPSPFIILTDETPERLEKAARIIAECLNWHEAGKVDGQNWNAVASLLDKYSIKAKEELKKFPAPSKLSSSKGTPKIPQPTNPMAVITCTHIFDLGAALCGLKGQPHEWPRGNDRVSKVDYRAANCIGCVTAWAGRLVRT